MIAAAGPSPLWYLSRGTGAVALVLLTATVVLGITSSMRLRPGSRTPRFVVAGLHRNLSLLAVCLLAVHIATAVLDPFAHLGLGAAFVPFASSYRPVWLGLGVLAFDLLVAIALTSLVRRRLGLGAWRAVHWAAYACWPAAVLHGLGTGTDPRSGWFEVLTVACVFATVAALAARAMAGWPRRAGLRLGVLGLTAGAVFAATAFALGGPLAPGWAHRAGTPTALLASARPVAQRTGAASAALRLPLSGPLQGTIRQSRAQTADRVDIAAGVRAADPVRVSVTIAGEPLSTGGLRMTSSSVRLGTPERPGLYGGRVVSLTGNELVARLHRPGARAVSLRLALNLVPGSSQVTGTANAWEAG